MKSILWWTLSALMFMGCARTTCDEANDYLLDECGLEPEDGTEDGSEVECSDGTDAACSSACTLAAPCAVFDGNLDPTDEDDMNTLDEYNACLDAC